MQSQLDVYKEWLMGAKSTGRHWLSLILTPTTTDSNNSLMSFGHLNT